jgi:hypothetical protein
MLAYNYMFTLLIHLTSFKCILHKYENVFREVVLPDKWVDSPGMLHYGIRARKAKLRQCC